MLKHKGTLSNCFNGQLAKQMGHCSKQVVSSSICLLGSWLILNSSVSLAAGGPYVVDDADVTERGQCHVEAWHSYQNSNNAISVVAPACNIGGIEWTLMGIRTTEAGEGDTTGALEAKYLAHPISPGGVGVAVTLGLGSGESLNRAGEAYLNVPLSYQPVDELLLHLNLGSLYGREDSSWSSTWGLGFDWEFMPRLNLIGEHFGDDRGFSAWQLGLRPAVVEDSVFLDFTWGRNLEDISGDWFTVGVVWEL